ncbi:hypothetical protein Cni_G01971 [Canna indica]|uniref:Meiosis-specific protein ASY3-like coiled-coil domain-containing protein n=1 Tax=Canna indica TaxID=4628 RepID=A0AAQ3JNU6_9LILI|nr:hypothetical protein Cni_G01971 [Canna indica]
MRLHVRSLLAGSSDVRSLGSNHCSSGRFPKVSIGIPVDKCPKLWSEGTNESGSPMPACERRPSSQENVIKREEEPGTPEASKTDGKLNFTDKEASENLCTRFISHETPTMQTDHVFSEHTAEPDADEGVLNNATFVAFKGDQTGDAEKCSSWFYTKPLLHETPTMQKFQFFANQASVREPEDEVHKRTATISFQMKENSAKATRESAVSFTSVQEMHMLHNDIDYERPKEVPKFNNGALKMKLWEILGMTSQEKQNMDSPKPDEKKESSRDQFDMRSMANPIKNTPNPKEKEEPNRNQRRKPLVRKSVKAKQNSDTIESDSESPNEIIRRPVTRSLTRKSAPPTTVRKSQMGTRCGKIPLSSPGSESKLKLEENNIFTFDEGDAKLPRSGRHVNVNPNNPNGKRTEKKFHNLQLPKDFVLDKNLEFNERENIVLSPDKIAPRSKKRRSAPCQSFQDDKEKMQTSNKVPNMNHHLEPEAKHNLVTPPIASSAETQEPFDTLKRKRYAGEHDNGQVPVDPAKGIYCSSMEKISRPFVDFQSPTFAMDTSPPQRSKLLSEGICTPMASQGRSPSKASSRLNLDSEDLCTPVTSRGRSPSKTSSRSYSDNLSSDPKSLDETKGMNESENLMFQHDEKGKEAQEHPSLSPNTNQDNRSFEASDFSSKGGYRSSEEWFLHERSHHKSHVDIHQKRIHSPKDKKISKSQSSPSVIGTSRNEEPTRTCEAMEHYPEDSLARAVCQLALSLEKFKTKIKSHTCKKSSEILSAAGEEIGLQLQNAESQIEANIQKILSVGKSQRKCFESKFQEQQERLRFIHDKFKEEVDQHLLDCRNTLEKIEAYKIELKVGLDRQKVSHRKILGQVEEAIESQLRDAETRVAAIHKEANKRMSGLRHVVKEWMSEDSVH